jgi:hypothetical protein
LADLAILGGKPTKSTSFPQWPRFDEKERQGLMDVLESRIWWRTPGTQTLKTVWLPQPVLLGSEEDMHLVVEAIRKVQRNAKSLL